MALPSLVLPARPVRSTQARASCGQLLLRCRRCPTLDSGLRCWPGRPAALRCPRVHRAGRAAPAVAASDSLLSAEIRAEAAEAEAAQPAEKIEETQKKAPLNLHQNGAHKVHPHLPLAHTQCEADGNAAFSLLCNYSPALPRQVSLAVCWLRTCPAPATLSLSSCIDSARPGATGQERPEPQCFARQSWDIHITGAYTALFFPPEIFPLNLQAISNPVLLCTSDNVFVLSQSHGLPLAIARDSGRQPP